MADKLLNTFETVLAELFDHETSAVAANLVPDSMSRQKLAGGHPHRCAGVLHQPGRQAQMVGMEVGDDQPLDRPVQFFDDL